MRIVQLIVLFTFIGIQGFGGELNSLASQNEFNDDESIVFAIDFQDGEDASIDYCILNLAEFQACQLTKLHLISNSTFNYTEENIVEAEQLIYTVSSDTSPPYFKLN